MDKHKSEQRVVADQSTKRPTVENHLQLNRGGRARLGRMTRWVVSALVVAVGAGGLLRVATDPDLGFAGTLPPSSQSGAVWTVEASRGAVYLACPPGIFDEEAGIAAAASTGGVDGDNLEVLEMEGGGVAIGVGEEGSSARPSLDQFSVAAQDYPAALLAGRCTEPLNQIALTGASTITGEDSVLILSNPGPKPVTVEITGYTRGGLAGQVPTLTVPALSTESWRPASWFSEEEQLSLLLNAEGAGVSAWLQSTGHSGEVPIGIGIVQGTPLSHTLDFPGVAALPGESTLHVLNPTNDPIPIMVVSLSEEGQTPVPGLGDLMAEPGAMSLTVPALPESEVSLRVISSGDAIAGSLWAQQDGADDPVATGEKTQTRLATAPTSPVEVPPVDTWEELTEALETAGLEDIGVRLAVASSETSRWVKPGEGVPETEVPVSAAWIIRGNLGGSPVAAAVTEAELFHGRSAQQVRLEP